MTKLTGTVEGIIYRNEENGYTVLVLAAEKNIETVTGTFPLIREGDFVNIYGEYTEHDSYGTQFKATSYEIASPQTVEEIEAFLASGIVKGIGPKLARDIVDEFGLEALNIIEKTPEKLCVITGIGRKKAKTVSESYAECMDAQRTVMFLQKFGITPGMALKIFSRYGENTIGVLQSNPYKMVADIDGIGFLTADKVASSMGMDKDSYFRICACVQYTLTTAGNDGHTYLPKPLLIKRAAELLSIPEEQITNAFERMISEEKIIVRNVKGETAVYHPGFFYAEAIVAGNLLLLQASAETEYENSLDGEIATYEKSNGITLAQKQKQAAISAVTNGICVITGGPGTGKTTTLDCILHLLRKRGISIALAAPTGRAAKRMSAATGNEAKTIHRLLEYSKTDSGFMFKRNRDNPVDCAVCIVDEASMIDIFLMQALLEGLKKGTRLILVGDVDQLPSVGAGNVLGDIISSGCFPVVALTEVFRQAGESMIVTNAHKINQGEMPEVNTDGTDFFLVRRQNETDICRTVVDLCTKRLPDKYKISPFTDIQVLTPIKKGTCGVYSLNKALQNALNPWGFGRREHTVGEDVFREGDKVMQIRNNYERKWSQADKAGVITSGNGVFNGDGGIIHKIQDRTMTVVFDDGRASEYEFNELEEITLAYAISVHKSQGCEFPFVIMPMPMGGMRIMTRNLFYTAVTRASKTVVLCGSDRSMEFMINNTEIQKRYSALDERLRLAKEKSESEVKPL